MHQTTSSTHGIMCATAVAHPNIAFIKYWGNRDDDLRLPLTGSLSMNLDGLETRTTVCFEEGLQEDEFWLNGVKETGAGLERVVAFLSIVRSLWCGKSGIAKFGAKHCFARVKSVNNFPQGAGIASSASAFAALALAANEALGLELSKERLSSLARRGSGSASRSIPTGFVEWYAGTDDESSFAESFAPASHWDLVDFVVILEEGHKKTGSSDGHKLAHTSPLNALRVAGVPERLRICKDAILARDFERFAWATELDSEWMHAVMRTSTPCLRYWTRETEIVLWQARRWREQGYAVCATVDAGPNVHVIALESELEFVLPRLKTLPGVIDVLVASPGCGARVVQFD